jgi:hypothetical protein
MKTIGIWKVRQSKQLKTFGHADVAGGGRSSPKEEGEKFEIGRKISEIFVDVCVHVRVHAGGTNENK